jgi:hypothetical protein
VSRTPEALRSESSSSESSRRKKRRKTNAEARSEKPNFGPERPSLGPQKPASPAKPAMGPEKPSLGPERPSQGQEKPGATSRSKALNVSTGPIAMHSAVGTSSADRNLHLWTGKKQPEPAEAAPGGPPQRKAMFNSNFPFARQKRR